MKSFFGFYSNSMEGNSYGLAVFLVLILVSLTTGADQLKNNEAELRRLKGNKSTENKAEESGLDSELDGLSEKGDPVLEMSDENAVKSTGKLNGIGTMGYEGKEQFQEKQQEPKIGFGGMPLRDLGYSPKIIEIIYGLVKSVESSMIQNRKEEAIEEELADNAMEQRKKNQEGLAQPRSKETQTSLEGGAVETKSSSDEQHVQKKLRTQRDIKGKSYIFGRSQLFGHGAINNRKRSSFLRGRGRDTDI